MWTDVCDSMANPRILVVGCICNGLRSLVSRFAANSPLPQPCTMHDPLNTHPLLSTTYTGHDYLMNFSLCFHSHVSANLYVCMCVFTRCVRMLLFACNSCVNILHSMWMNTYMNYCTVNYMLAYTYRTFIITCSIRVKIKIIVYFLLLPVENSK